MPESAKRATETALFMFGVVLAATPLIYFGAVLLHLVGAPTPAQAAAGIAPSRAA